MSEIIEAIYEHGILRLSKPLSLPDKTHVQVNILVRQSTIQEEKQKVRQSLINAGIIWEDPSPENIERVSEERLAMAAKVIASAGSLSELIIAERDGR